jgi:hypothetical protein
MRLVLAWGTSPQPWIGWGRDRAVSARQSGLRGSSLYWVGIGPARLGVILAMSARQLAAERARAAPALRNPALAVKMRERPSRR